MGMTILMALFECLSGKQTQKFIPRIATLFALLEPHKIQPYSLRNFCLEGNLGEDVSNLFLSHVQYNFGHISKGERRRCSIPPSENYFATCFVILYSCLFLAH